MITKEAERELIELKKIQEEAESKRREMLSYGYREEERAWERKYWKAEEKINEIQKLGVSSKERTAVIKAIPGMTAIHGSKDIVGTSKEATGFVKKLNSYVVVSFQKYSSFLSNVRGASGLAGKYDIGSIRFITKRIHDEILAGVRGTGGYKQETSFMGMTQKTIGGIVQRNKNNLW